MHRPDRNLKDPLTLDLAKMVPRARERRQHGAQVEILPQRVHLRPVVMQRAAPRIRVTEQLQAKQVLDFALLPVDAVDGVRQRGKLRPVRRHRHAQDEETVRLVEGEYVIKVKDLLRRPDVVGKQTDQPPVPFAVQLRAKPGDHFHRAVKIDLVGARRAHGGEPAGKTVLQIG